MKKIVVLYYVFDCFYWYTSEYLGKWWINTLRNIFHVNFLVYAHCFMPIRISQMKDHSIYVDRDRYATSIVAKYLYTATVKASTKFHKTTLPYDMIFIKANASNSDDKIEKLTREFNIHYRSCIGSLIYLSCLKDQILVLQCNSQQGFQKTLVNYTLKVWYIY